MQALAQWCTSQLQSQGLLPAGPGVLEPLSGDASFRRYFRYRAGSQAWVAVHAPPDKEKNREFVDVRQRLADGGVAVPALLGWDAQAGFLLLSDLGDRLLLPELDAVHVDQRYRQALQQVVAMQSARVAGLPVYDNVLLREEMALFPEWYVARLLGLSLSAGEAALLERLFARLVSLALAQPRVFVHRDYHARNIMVLADDRLATIDFQDAVAGPALYDPVSLLKDCYVRWPRARVLGWLGDYIALASAAGVLPAGRDWVLAFDAMGLQRHIKVLGIFARLWLRDGKPGYLGDLTRVLGYTLEALSLHDDFTEAHGWFCERILPASQGQGWFRPDDLTGVRA